MYYLTMHMLQNHVSSDMSLACYRHVMQAFGNITSNCSCRPFHRALAYHTWYKTKIGCKVNFQHNVRPFLGCIECIKWRLLLPMIAVSVCLMAQLSFTVPLNRWQCCFGMNTPGSQWNIVLDGGPDPHTERGGELENFANFGPTTFLKNGWS